MRALAYFAFRALGLSPLDAQAARLAIRDVMLDTERLALHSLALAPGRWVYFVLQGEDGELTNWGLRY